MQEEKNYVVRGLLLIGENVTIDIGCVFEGHIVLCDNVKIGPYCVIKDSVIEENTEVLPFSFIVDSNIGENCSIGPYARLRDDADIGNNVVVGNFVEIKKSFIGNDTHAKHHTYLGDADIGKNVNFGCGTITCNYDGVNKNKTVIGDNAFIGAGSQLIAPVTIGSDTVVAAGSVITDDIPNGHTAFGRARQVNKLL